MALVDYSDSDSDSETTAQPTPKPAPPTTAAAAAKKPIQKVVDRSNPRKIVVSLGAAPTANSLAENSDEPPAKRARTTGGGGVFGGFASLLPPPKNRVQPAAQQGSSSSKNTAKAPPRVGINLKTGAAPGFSRSVDERDDNGEGESNNKQPSIPEGQKPAEEVQLVGKPLMFKPLSVSRKPKKIASKAAAAAAAAQSVTKTPAATTVQASPPTITGVQEDLPKRKKVSLFSISAQDDGGPDASSSNGAYEPMFDEETTTPGGADDFAAYDAQYSSTYADPSSAGAAHMNSMTVQADSLESIASDMNLDATARRELFGRRGAPAPSQSASRVINFNTDQEYAHNEAIRASGEQQIYNPVRNLAPGKHSLKQLVDQVQNQKDALEESFAKSKTNQREAGQRYGWR